MNQMYKYIAFWAYIQQRGSAAFRRRRANEQWNAVEVAGQNGSDLGHPGSTTRPHLSAFFDVPLVGSDLDRSD